MNSILEFDQWLTILINSWHSPWVDYLMIGFSSKWLWIPLYVFLLWAFTSKNSWKKSLVFFLAVVVLITLADQTSVQAFKFQFERLRPCHQAGVMEFLHLPSGCGGKYGFVSSHATNTMALATFMFGVFRVKWIRILLIFYVVSNVYSRVYLGVHYVGDVLGGVILGFAIGMIISLLFSKMVTYKKWL